jgi:hypothetical protein
MQALVGVVQSKVQSKLDSLNAGFSDLAGSTDPMEHRRIFDRTRRAVTDVDMPATTPAGFADAEPDFVVVNGRVQRNPRKVAH